MKNSGKGTLPENSPTLKYIEHELYPICYTEIFSHNEGQFHTFCENTHLTYSHKTGNFNTAKFNTDLVAIHKLFSEVSIQDLAEEANEIYASIKNSQGKNLEGWIRSIRQTVARYTYFGVNSHKMDVVTRLIDHCNQIMSNLELSESEEIPPFDPDDEFDSGLKVA